jgi:hypothetical protein
MVDLPMKCVTRHHIQSLGISPDGQSSACCFYCFSYYGAGVVSVGGRQGTLDFDLFWGFRVWDPNPGAMHRRWCMSSRRATFSGFMVAVC